jgi:hypothetical protein
MSSYPLIWLGAITLCLVASVSVILLGCYLLRGPVEDLSNSTAWSAYVLRLWRMTPGLIISMFGCFVLFRIVQRILALSVSGP